VSCFCRTYIIHHLITALEVVHALFDGRSASPLKASPRFGTTPGEVVVFMADAASMDHVANSIPREVGFAVASR
jgi:hypothetical protein